MKTLTLERARELLSYDPETGVIIRKVSNCNRVKDGEIAGSLRADGYLATMVDGKLYKNHRIAWFMHTGAWPEKHIDHINGIRTDNRISNLREAGYSLNAQNQKRAHTDNKTGLLGVIVERGKFRAQITIKGATKRLGAYSTPETAHQAYLTAKRAMHEGCTI
jgi:hypothetical protein